MTAMKMISLTIGAAMALSGCVGVVKNTARSADNQAYQAANTSSRSCPSDSALGAQYDATVNGNSFNQGLFGEAVLHFTNARRCDRGLAPLASDSGLTAAASGHSDDMVRMNFFGHNSPVAGKARLTDRLNGNNVRYTAAAENLATRSRLQLVSGRQFFVRDRASCNFAYDQSGPSIQPHSYRSLAQQFVELWEASPEHSRNMFNSDYTRLGSGGSFKQNPRNCGDIVATQNFAA